MAPEPAAPLGHGSLVRLRPIGRADLPRIAAWQQDPSLFDTLVGPHHAVTEDEAVRWMERHWFGDPGQIRMAICRAADGAHIGNAYLLDIDRTYRSASFGIFLGRAADRGRGYGREAVLLTLERAFEVEGLRRVALDVLAANDRAIRLYRSCGFREEGVSREAAWKGGRWVDVLRMAVLAHEHGHGHGHEHEHGHGPGQPR